MTVIIAQTAVYHEPIGPASKHSLKGCCIWSEAFENHTSAIDWVHSNSDIIIVYLALKFFGRWWQASAVLRKSSAKRLCSSRSCNQPQ